MCDKQKWLKEAGKCMAKRYGLSIADAGLNDDEFWVRWGDEGETSPDIAVKSYGEKYDLIDFEDSNL